MFARTFGTGPTARLGGVGLIAGAAGLYAAFGLQVAAAPLALAIIFAAFVLGAGPIADLSALSRLSLRWKVSGMVFLMVTVLLAVALANWATIQYTHNQIHDVQAFRAENLQSEITQSVLQGGRGPNPELLKQMQIRADEMGVALNMLESTQHGILSWTPALIFAGGFIAIALGVALSSSLVRPLEKMREATRRLAAGDFSRALEIPNRDELGELAASINNAARDLPRHQEALITAERARGLEERIASVTKAHEEERRRLSREIHDGLGPSLAALGYRLHLSRELIRSDPAQAEANLDDVTSSLRDHIRMTRGLINELRPLDLDQLGLVGALTQYVERFGRECEIKASFSVSGTPPTDPLTEVTIYRVIQESLNNVRKHSRASAVEVSLSGSVGGTEVVVTDTGDGFDPEKLAKLPGAGIGLASMRERSEILGGLFTVESSNGHGCRVRLQIPTRTAWR